MARLEGFPLQKSSGRALLLAALIFINFCLEKLRKQPYFENNSAGRRMARGAFGRGLVKLKVPDTDVRADGALV